MQVNEKGGNRGEELLRHGKQEDTTCGKVCFRGPAGRSLKKERRISLLEKRGTTEEGSIGRKPSRATISKR